MGKIFNISLKHMEETASIYTLQEIYQQPNTWRKTCQQITKEKVAIQEFINQVITCDDYDVILTGAGTSEFVGNTLMPYLNTGLKYKVKSYATTDILATPDNYLSTTKPTLLISFGRSGNSPESIGVVEVANQVCQNLYHLFITCNKNGALSNYAKNNDHCYAINLADETHDQGFAMTSSFTNMYLATYLCFHLTMNDDTLEEIKEIITTGQQYLDMGYSQVNKIISSYRFERIVYLGSNSLKGVAQESALKMLELTAGRTVTMYDSPLGFRHGPKSIVNDQTLTVVYVSDDSYTRKYEIDLIIEMSKERKQNKIVAVLNQPDEMVSALVDYTICFNANRLKPNILLGLNYILFAQMLAVFASLSMKITPDNPCPTGEVNRVVKGVTLYTYQGGKK